MESIPDSWPPDDLELSESAEPTMVVPVFPLPGVFLFPRQLMPLHVFEPRYRQMVEDCLDGPGRIVIGTIRNTQDPEAESPALLPIAGLGEIARHEKLADGRFHVWLFGLMRVAIEEVPSDRLYRKVRCRILQDAPPTTEEEQRLRKPLAEAINARTKEEIELPERVPISLLCDLLTQHMELPQSVMEGIFSEVKVSRRASRALDAHLRFPLPPTELG